MKECERLDQSLALALKHLTLPHQRTAPGTPSHTHTHTDVDGQMGTQILPVTATYTHTHSDMDRHNTETHKEAWMDVSTLLDSCTGELECFYLEFEPAVSFTCDLGSLYMTS